MESWTGYVATLRYNIGCELIITQCAKWGVEADLIRFSVGLEETGKLVEAFKMALEAIPSQ
jgi:cystathionine beta-lyase/cystathionine gamma-synthase